MPRRDDTRAPGWSRSLARSVGLILVVGLLAAGCATSRAVRTAGAAEQRGDWDAAVTAYRDALQLSPDRVDLRIRLTRATQEAVAMHMQRALDYEALEQLSGAVAEYRLAAELDPSNRLAAQKAAELERRLRDAVEAARPPARIDTLREQAAQTSPVPRLDPSIPLPALRYESAAVGDILDAIASLTGINVWYDNGLEAALSRPQSLDVTETSLEDVLNQIMRLNQLTYKVVNPQTILIYQDTQQKRNQWEDKYLRIFYLSHASVDDIGTQLNNIVTQAMNNVAVRPVITPNEASNSVTVVATAPVMDVIDNLISSLDKAIPSVMIEAEILEVNRNFLRRLGPELNQWALGLTFSPEVAPPLTTGTFPPASPPPFNLNTISGGVSTSDTYVTTPTALINLLESNTDTRVLARPQIMGQAGTQVSLQLGDQVPIPQTTFFAGSGGGIANIPTTQVQYQSVGVNLLFTPRVSYQDEILLEDLQLEKSGLGAFIDVGGQSFPTINSRSAATSLRLRDGQSAVIAGLFQDDERQTIRSLPGLSRLPVLNRIFGNSDRQVDQTDLIMIITPRIVRPHELTPDDLRPLYIGTGTDVGTGPRPLLSSEAVGTDQPSPPAPGVPTSTEPAPATPATPVPATPPPPQPVPIQPAPEGPAAPLPETVPEPEPEPLEETPPAAVAPVPVEPVAETSVPPMPQSQLPTRIVIAPPPTVADEPLAVGSPTGTITIQVSGARDLATMSLTINYDPRVLTQPLVGRGSFMGQGGVEATFGQSIDTNNGEIVMAFSRPAGEPGASSAGIVGAVQFRAAASGTSPLTISGTAATTSGESVPLEFTSAEVTVR